MNYWTTLFKDPSFMGALLGAVITGGIALIIFYKDKRNAKKERRKEFNRLFYIEVSLFHSHTVHMYEMLNEFSTKEVKLPDVLPTLQVFINKLQNKLKKTNPRYLKNSILNEFHQIIEIIDKLELLLNKMHDDYQYYDKYERDDGEDKQQLIKIIHLLKDPLKKIDKEYGVVKRTLK